MSSSSAFLIDSEGSVVATMGSKHVVNLSICSGILKNIHSRVKDLVPEENPIVVIETNRFTLVEKKRGDNLVCMIETDN